MRPRIVIIGYGNTLRGDDGLGYRVAERLIPLEMRGRIRVVASHQLSIDFAEMIADSELVIFVDASRDGAPGEIRSSVVTAHAVSAGDDVMTHHLTPESLLSLSKTLYGGSPEAALVTVSGESFDLSEQLSPTVEAELLSVVLHVQSLVAVHVERSVRWGPG